MIGLAASVLLLLQPAGAAAAEPTLAASPCASAESLAKAGAKKEAAEDYVAVLKADPQSICAATGLGELNKPSSEPAAPDCARGAIYLDAERGDDAAAAYKSALEKNPAAKCAVEGLGKVQIEKRRAAKQDCERGDALYDAGRDEDAIAAYKQALEKNPKSDCATAGLDKTGPTFAKEILDDIPGFLTWIGLFFVAIFALLLLGYFPWAHRPIQKIWVIGKLIAPRLSIGTIDDEPVEGKPGTAIATRINERLRRISEEATKGAGEYDLDSGRPRDEFANVVSDNGGLKDTLEKASAVSEQTKILAALLELLYVALPVRRYAISGSLEPPAKGVGPGGTMILELDAKLIAATTLSGPRVKTKTPEAPQYLALADPAAVWVQYEVARSLQGDTIKPGAAESYASLREALDRYAAADLPRAQEACLEAIRLNDHNWAAYVSLAIIEARLGRDYEAAIRILQRAIAKQRTTAAERAEKAEKK